MKCDYAVQPTLYFKFRLLRMLIVTSVSQWSQTVPKARQ